ncbi:efflux RND transporter periplasmic adaptor subunit [Chloroflexota bacterium]
MNAQDNLTNARERLARGTGEDVFEDRLLAVKDFWTLRAAELEMEKKQSALDNTKNTLNKIKMTVEKARYDLEVTKETLDKAVITAPFNGIIAKINVEEGDFLSSTNYATTIAIEIIEPGRMELNLKVNELDIPNIKLGQKVNISVDALPDERFESVVTSIISLPIVEAGMVSYEVIIAFDVPVKSALKAGMGATADIIVDKRS